MQCVRCGGKGTVFGEGTASIPCPNCGGTGYIMDDMMRGYYHHFPTGSPCSSSWSPSQPVKTLLDEYAIAAMQGMLANPEVMADIADESTESLAKAYSIMAWTYAAAMLREKMRRDEMGNVKGK